MAQKTGSETMGATGAKNQMTLFKDDRSEDTGAIVLAAIVIAIVMVMTTSKPGAPAATATPAAAPAATAAPAAAAEPAKK